MYEVLVDNKLIFDSTYEDLKIFNPDVDLEVNRSGQFSFTMYPDHPSYETIKTFTSVVEVFQNGDRIFRGRPLDVELGFDKSKTWYCEGDLAFLMDSIQRPYEWTGGLNEYFEFLIERHNDQVEASKKFVVGNITVTDPNDFIVRADSQFLPTLTILQSKLVNLMGGYIQVRHVDGVNYLDYLVDSTYRSDQVIQLGDNIMDLNQSRKGADIFTALVPTGATIEYTDELTGETVESVVDIRPANDGVDFIYDQDAVDKFGWIYKHVQFENITEPLNLLTRARKELGNGISYVENIQVSAIDKSIITREGFSENQIPCNDFSCFTKYMGAQATINKTYPIDVFKGGKNLFQSESLINVSGNTNSMEYSLWEGTILPSKNLLEILKVGETYTLSYEMELLSLPTGAKYFARNCGINIYSPTDPTLIVSTIEAMTDVGQKKRIVRTFTINQLKDQRLLGYSTRNTDPVTTGRVRITNLKLEKGSVATEWSPNPQDGYGYNGPNPSYHIQTTGGISTIKLLRQKAYPVDEVVETSVKVKAFNTVQLSNNFLGQVVNPNEYVDWSVQRVSNGVRNIGLQFRTLEAADELDFIACDASVRLWESNVSDFHRFKIFEYVKVLSEPHGVDEFYLIKKQRINLTAPQQNTITVGVERKTLTDSSITVRDELNVIRDKNVVTNSKITETYNNLSLTIIESADKYYREVKEEISNEMDQLRSETSTQFAQFNDEFLFQFNNLLEKVVDLDDETRTHFEQIVKYIRFLDGNIILGQIGNDLTLKISNNRISFLQNNAEVAYISDNRLYINDGTFLNTLQLGNFAFTPRENGNLSFGKVV